MHITSAPPSAYMESALSPLIHSPTPTGNSRETSHITVIAPVRELMLPVHHPTIASSTWEEPKRIVILAFPAPLLLAGSPFQTIFPSITHTAPAMAVGAAAALAPVALA